MVKILVADESIEQANLYCQYLTKENKTIETTKVNSGNEALLMYDKIKANILILDNNFKDINSMEIVDRLSSTVQERKNSNIILTINSKNEHYDFDTIAKIYCFLYKPLDLQKLNNVVKQIIDDNQFEEIDEHELNQLLFSLKFVIGSTKTELLKTAIIECYHYPYLLDKFETLLQILAYRYKEMDIETIRTYIRSSLNHLNKKREKLPDHPILKMFTTDQNVSPKAFFEAVVTYIHIKKNQGIFF